MSIANARQLPVSAPVQIVASDTTVKSKLAAEVLTQTGIASRYDLHFDHLIGMLVGKGDDFKLYARFNKMFAREIGWRHFKDTYATRLVTDFSTDELKELLKLSKQPVMQKLLKSEFKTYTDTSKQRAKMGFELWDKYNSGSVSIPE